VSHPGKTLAQALGETSAATLIARCERADQAARILSKTLTEMNLSSGPIPLGACQIRERLLLVFATSAAQAAKLRQALPGLLRVLHERGFDLSEIRVRVQPAPSDEPDIGGGLVAPTPGNQKAPRLSTEEALRFADKLSLTLRPSPLRDAAVRLAKGLRAGSARS
jgi:hypothetical protein